MDYASELAEIITLIYNDTFCGNCGRKPEALKTEGIAFNEIEVYQTTLAPFKISDQEKFDGIMFLVHLQLKAFDKQQNQNEICFVSVLHCKSIRVKENKEYCNC
jgi:uroporphyrinogen-III synthase